MNSSLISVATVLTACGIETSNMEKINSIIIMLQQYLPLAVLKLNVSTEKLASNALHRLQQYLPLAVLKRIWMLFYKTFNCFVATVLTACGIETHKTLCRFLLKLLMLQQYLPLAVLKPIKLLKIVA